MKSLSIHCYLIAFVSCAVTLTLTGCVAFDPVVQSEVQDLSERPIVAILPFDFGLEITNLSTVQSVEEELSAEDEAIKLDEALKEIRSNARWLLLSRLATGNGFRFISIEETDALVKELHIAPNTLPTVEQCAEFRRRSGADFLIAGSILDYGKVRWQFWVPGLIISMMTETLIVGAASGFNPGLMAVTAASELLTDLPVWWGGAYIAGWAFRPVRVEARAFDTLKGYPIWQSMEESVYAYEALKLLPEDVRGRKETQLTLNLAEIMESFGDGLIKQGHTVSRLRGPAMSFPQE